VKHRSHNITAPDAAEPVAVEAPIRYVVPGEKAVFYPGERERSYWPEEDHLMRIENLRLHLDTLSLEANGLTLLQHATALTNFDDEDQIRTIYYPEIIALVQQLTGAEQVLVFGHVKRTDDNQAAPGQLPAYGAHVDYGDYTVRQFATDILGEAAAGHWLQRRFMLMNLWRPVHTVQRTPLALCDASTVQACDLNDSEIRGGLMDPDRPPLYGYNLSYNPQHRWYYVPQMQPHEILAFKLFDSDKRSAQWTGHTAFDDPTAAADAPPRVSLEVRTISFMPQTD
jgi:hypothetical protein